MCEGVQKIELGRSEVYFCPIAIHDVSPGVERWPVELQLGRVFAEFGASQDCVETSNQFVHANGFCQMVLGPGVEGSHLFLYRGHR